MVSKLANQTIITVVCTRQSQGRSRLTEIWAPEQKGLLTLYISYPTIHSVLICTILSKELSKLQSLADIRETYWCIYFQCYGILLRTYLAQYINRIVCVRNVKIFCCDNTLIHFQPGPPRALDF